MYSSLAHSKLKWPFHIYTDIPFTQFSETVVNRQDRLCITFHKKARCTNGKVIACGGISKSTTLFIISSMIIVLSHYRVSTHVSTAYQDTKGTSRVRRTYVSIRSSYSSIRSSYSSYAEVLRFLCVHLKIRSTYVAGPIRRTYVTHT